MNLRIGVKGNGQRKTFHEWAVWAWDLQKRVAAITGVRKWGPALKRKFDIDDPEIFPAILRDVKSSYNVKSVSPVRYDKIPDDMYHELPCSATFGGPFMIMYGGSADPLGQYAKFSKTDISVRSIDESKISREMLMEIFIFFIEKIDATEGQLDDDSFWIHFKDKMNFTRQEGAYKKIVRYKWTGLYTFLPDHLLTDFNLEGYNYSVVPDHGVIVSMAGVDDVKCIMDFNRKVAAMYDTVID